MTDLPQNGPPLLVECIEHQTVPFHLVCQHMVGVPVDQWTAVPSVPPREVESDYLCPTCQAVVASGDYEELVDGGSLKLVCYQCMRALLHGAGKCENNK